MEIAVIVLAVAVLVLGLVVLRRGSEPEKFGPEVRMHTEIAPADGKAHAGEGSRNQLRVVQRDPSFELRLDGKPLMLLEPI